MYLLAISELKNCPAFLVTWPVPELIVKGSDEGSNNEVPPNDEVIFVPPSLLADFRVNPENVIVPPSLLVALTVPATAPVVLFSFIPPNVWGSIVGGKSSNMLILTGKYAIEFGSSPLS